jgi:hypothetical protein
VGIVTNFRLPVLLNHLNCGVAIPVPGMTFVKDNRFRQVHMEPVSDTLSLFATSFRGTVKLPVSFCLSAVPCRPPTANLTRFF